MRSVLANFRPYARKFHLITSDFQMPQELVSGNLSYSEDWRLGQLPQWLDFSNKDWTDESIDLNLIRHAEIFKPYLGTNFNRSVGVSFRILFRLFTNLACVSYAIESQFAHLENLTEYL